MLPQNSPTCPAISPMAGTTSVRMRAQTSRQTVTLTPAALGKISVIYHFKAGETNEVSNSTTLTNWTDIGTRVSDTQGTAELEQVDPAQVPTQFYRLVPK